MQRTEAPPHNLMTFSVHTIKGRRQILRHLDLLKSLAEQFGQPAAMHGVEHFLDGAGRGKIPYLLFAVDGVEASCPLTLDTVRGAGLLYEFRVLGLRSGILVTEGKDGMRSILAPIETRAAVASALCPSGLESGATLIVASYSAAVSSSEPVSSTATDPCNAEHAAAIYHSPILKDSVRWASSTRSIPGYLPLGNSLEQTLQSIHRRTRANFRYYRRRLEAVHPLEFISGASAELTLKEMQRLNHNALGPVPAGTIALRHRSFADSRAYSTQDLSASAQGLQASTQDLPAPSQDRPASSQDLAWSGTFICGLRTQAGEWLSLIGGWRQQTTTVLKWQLNVRGYEEFSLVTVARSFWIEHEITSEPRSCASTEVQPTP